MNENALIGLSNKGKNMCFLNVIMQSLWNLSSFKNYILNINSHRHSLQLQYRDIILAHFAKKQAAESQKIQFDINNVPINPYDKIVTDLLDDNFDKEGNLAKESCLLCFLNVFFSNYKYSEKGDIDAMFVRKLLLMFNDSIQKFNLEDVKSLSSD